jgi:hypothetical protein
VSKITVVNGWKLKGPPMGVDNVIYIDFRFSKDIRSRQVLPIAEWRRPSSADLRAHYVGTKSALDLIRMTPGNKKTDC